MTRLETSSDHPGPEGSRSVVGNILRGSLGNLVEWYDFYVLSAFAVYFGSSFFDKSDQLSNTLNVLGIFAVGFLIARSAVGCSVGSLIAGAGATRSPSACC